ncbi:double-strand break repair helicase AddA [Roseovarius sp. 2305UL8-3]|uniref:double-strand break repair helicase AddA n=1 Tax=Roseovarius conchicola TaxID=3121636 RepID=UPI003527F69B
MQRNEATNHQIKAAQPHRSTWLSANAGSGKTRVLTDRVARLLLDRVDPQHILCLTYTKAAASEMQNRLFRRLGDWAMLPDSELSDQLRELGIEASLGPDDLRHARRLFARAIETPGGLKIQTIHSFCSALLRRFPLEAGVTPQFTEMEERTASLLRSEIVEEIASGPEADTLYTMARHYTGESFADLTAEIVRHRSHFAETLTDAVLEDQFGQPADLTLDDIADLAFIGDEQPLLDAMIPALESSSANDQKAAAKLAEIAELDARALPRLESVFLTGPSAKEPFTAKMGSFPTKNGQSLLAAHMPGIEAWMRRVEAARPARLTQQAIAKTQALHAFAQVFLPAYDAAKQARGWLDFDDLILRARDLLTDPDVAAWVLFRLDGGIDHILVDEAQDTSPVQWQVIERLAQEFTSGEGARTDVLRTIFVVGDKKQSIYSFQGADPREFDRMQSEFAQRLSASETPLQQMELAYSFRSSHAILSLVDKTFSQSEKSGFTPEQSHKAFKSDMPGRVDLWPVIPPPEKEDKPDWHDPVDVKAANDPSVLLAREIASSIKAMIDARMPLPQNPEDGGPYRWRAVQPGDFLILVQRRSDLFHEIIRECKNHDLAVAGADRLKVGAELAVRDLAALLSFLATPEDSLSLAVALKSPLFGWSEAQLYDLAQGRNQKYLWAEMRDRADEFPDTMPILRDLLQQADFLRPYDLIERILTRHHGRHRLLSRLGPEAEDGIDALLAQAMAYERHSVDSLTGFLIWMETDDLEIKRQMDSAGNRIRVMTVHGAKGLEAPIVILPDSGKRDVRLRDQMVITNGTPLWRTSSDEAPSAILEANEDAKTRERAERDRLLYVAMTRAEKWLIVAAAGDLGKNGDSWHDKIRNGMTEAGATPHAFSLGEGLRLSHGDWAETETESGATKEVALPPLPSLFEQPAPHVDPKPETLSPSDLGGAKALPGEGLDEDAAKLRGRQIHQLLEILPDLPQNAWPGTAVQILGQGADPTLLSEAARVLTAPSLVHIFDGNALAEVPITASLPALQDRRIHGVIDRLIITDTHVTAIDFKTNAVTPETPATCPDGLLRQMGAYAHALQIIYPDRQIDTAILWTRTATLMPLPHDLVTDALRTTQIS